MTYHKGLKSRRFWVEYDFLSASAQERWRAPSQSSPGLVAGGEVGETWVRMGQRGRGDCCEVGGRGVGAGTSGRGQQSEEENGESRGSSLASGRGAWKRAWQGGVCAPGAPASLRRPSAGTLPGSPSTVRLRARAEAAAS